MNISLNRTHLARCFHWMVDLFIVKTGATCVILALIFTLSGGLQTYTQSLVTIVAKAAWLGTAPDGHIRVYSCTNGTPIDRLTIVGNTNPCPESEVTTLSIEESARYSAERLQQVLLSVYFAGLFFAVLWSAPFSTVMAKLKRLLLHRKKEQ